MIKKLERSLGLVSVISISMGSMLGSGIFVLPGVAFYHTGPSLYLAFLLSALCILPAAISKSELATAMPTSGGTYIYLERTFGPLAGTVAGLGLFLSLLLKSSFALVGFSEYLSVIHPSLSVEMPALIILAFITVVNIYGVGKASSFVTITVIISLLCLFALGGLSAFDFHPSHFHPLFPKGKGEFLSAVALIFVAFAGVTKVAAIAEEIKDPGKNLPRGILTSLFIVTIIYSSVTYFMAGVLPMESLIGNLRPIYTWAEKLGGKNIGLLAAAIAILTMTSMANAGMLAASRFPFAMGRDKLLPSFFGKIHGRFLTPVASILLSGGIIALIILFFDVEKIAKLASAFMILIYMLENIAVIVLREFRVQWYKPTYKSFAYPFLQIFGVLSSLFLLFYMGHIVFMAIAAVGLPGLLIYLLYSRRQMDRMGVLGIRLPRKDLSEPAIGHKVEDIHFSEDANVVVAMFGKEKSPEVLTEMGLALADGKRLEVAHLTEAPEQTELSDFKEESVDIRAIRRRVYHMAKQQEANVGFDSIVSHDLFKTVSEISQRLQCQWLVTEWGERPRGMLTLYNPMGWLRNHLFCHLMTFKDKGVRYFKKILVIVKVEAPSELLIQTAKKLAESSQGEITLTTFLSDEEYEDKIEFVYEKMKWFHGHCGKAADSMVVRGASKWDEFAKITDEFDLVIFEAEKITSPYEGLFGSRYDRFVQKSACSVISIQESVN